jgi:hypothetical protein
VRALPCLLISVFMAMPMAAMAGDLTVDAHGIGAIRIGTRLSKIPLPLEKPIERTVYRRDGYCFFVSPRNGPDFLMMIEGEVLTRVDILKAGIRSKNGVGVGDPIKKVKDAYGVAAVETPNFYDDKQPEFTVKSKDGRHALRFSTTDGLVTSISAGRLKAVQYVEGCL